MIGYQAGNEALTHSVEQRLAAQREIKRQRIETYVRNQLRVTSVIGGAQETIEATQTLIAAVSAMHADRSRSAASADADTHVLEAWYRGQFLPRLERIAGAPLPLEGVLPSDPVSRQLQADYIARNPYPAGQKYKFAGAPEDSAYNTAHARFHAMLQRQADAVGFYDINIVDARTGDIVYTVAKETDFGTNLYHGPYARSGLARVVQRALDPRNGGAAVIEDYTPYEPSAFAPQMFTAVPVVIDGQAIGVFTAQIDIKTLNGLVTDNERWQEAGQGDTGEVLLVGEDRLLRSESRFRFESPASFLDQAEADGLPVATAEQIRNLGTTILYMPERTEAIELAFRNKTGFARYLDYRGKPVMAAYGPLEVAGLRWAVAAKQDVADAFAPTIRLRRSLLTAAATAAIVLTFVAFACAATFARPLRRVLAGMKSFRATGDLARVPIQGEDEFGELAHGYNKMVAAIEEQADRLAAAEREKSELLRTIYPEAIAERVRHGTEVIAETISNTTVAVAWIDGLDEMGSALTPSEIRQRLDVLWNALGKSASAHGVEPVRSLGESYIVVCGLSSPRLDHAARTLAWAREASIAAEQLSKNWGASISLRFGLASGGIDVLLLSHGHSAFDIWGHTLRVARYIAVGTPSGHVSISDSTYGLLSDVRGFERCPATEGAAWGSISSWVRPAVPRELAQAP